MIKVKGDGNIVSKEVNVNSFVRLHIQISGMIELIQAEEEKIVIETDENLQEYMEIVNSGRTLYINTEGKWRIPDFTTLKIKVFYRQLYNIYNACENAELVCVNTLRSGEPVEIKIHSNKSVSRLDVDASAIKLMTACVGDVEIKGNCNVFDVSAKSQGNLFAKGMKAKNVTLKNYSQGNLELFASDTLNISNYGQGNIYYWGDGLLKDIKQYGDGEVRHRTED